jgi:hypothetical protein
MTQERMLELLLLYKLANNSSLNLERYKILRFEDGDYSAHAIMARYKALMKEFLEPYVIDSNPKG